MPFEVLLLPDSSLRCARAHAPSRRLQRRQSVQAKTRIYSRRAARLLNNIATSSSSLVMPATRSSKKDTGKAGAPKTPAKAATKAASRTTPRSKAKQATKASTSSDPTASSSPPRTRSRAPKASAALTQHATSPDSPSSSPAKTRGSKAKAMDAPDQSMSSSGPPPSSPANTRGGKRKAASALEQTASSPPAKTRRQSARVAGRASTAEPVAAAPIIEDPSEEKNDVERSGPVSQTEGQDTDSSLSTIDSDVFNEEAKKRSGEQEPEVKDVPMVDAEPEPNTSTIVAASDAGPKPAAQKINDTTTATDQSQKSEVVAASDSTGNPEPEPSATTTSVAQVLDLAPAVQANIDTTDATAESQKSQAEAEAAEAETLEAITESGASLSTTTADTKGPVSSQKASSSTKATSAGGRKSRAKPSTSKATKKSTASKKAPTPTKKLDPMPSTQVGSGGDGANVEDQMSHAKGTTSRVDSTTTTAEEASHQASAPASTNDNTMVGAQNPKSPSKENSEPGTVKTSEVAANEPEQIQTIKDDGGAAVTVQPQVESVVSSSKDLHVRPPSAGEGEAKSMSDSGANITPAPFPGTSPQRKDLPEPEVSTSAATPSPRLPLATSSISPLSGAVNPHPPITPNALSETDSSVVVKNGPRQGQQAESPAPPEELLLTGQSFKVLQPVYEDLRKLIELKDEQKKEVVDGERKLLWKLYKKCSKLKEELDEHERRKNERKKI
ncbi:hypothetical protein HDK90DRAFT_304126 [Phyllosticta capitalensis]|uniref:Uncharacterized protein n=1 Tax=Phyllosticta capitalensis TaxID=121624 RepID=A0ABR1YKR3_9PEZI